MISGSRECEVHGGPDIIKSKEVTRSAGRSMDVVESEEVTRSAGRSMDVVESEEVTRSVGRFVDAVESEEVTRSMGQSMDVVESEEGMRSMQKDEVAVVKIEDIGVDGEGIGKVDGYTLFVKDAVIGDEVEVKVIKAKRNYGYARLTRIIKPSVHRVEPKCPYARQCGGCQIQEMSYERQLAFKEKKVRDSLERIGGFDVRLLENVTEPIVGMEHPFHYRNKAQFPFGTDKDGQPVCGFYAGRTHHIIANTDCALGVEVNKEILERILDFMREYRIQAYDEKTGGGLVRHVLIRYGFTTKEIMVCLVINGYKIPHVNELVRRLAPMKGMTAVTLSSNTKRTNVIMGDSYEVLWGRGYITDYIGGVRYQISPLSFYQVNPVQTEKLYGLALEYAGLQGGETVWDLYCGIGTISLFLAKRAKEVYGVEIVPQAVEDARENAKRNGMENVWFYEGRAEDVLPEYYERKDGKARPDVIVVDPPRKGCEESLLQTMAAMRPDRIVYVSCNPATLSRDLKYLCGRGYELGKVGVVDQFPMGVHVETVVQLSHKKPDDTIEIDLDLDELDATVAETKATYEEIKAYVWDKYHLKVSSLYISQIKRKCGLEVDQNYNLSKSENPKAPKCPPEKEAAIMDTLKHFQMI